MAFFRHIFGLLWPALICAFGASSCQDRYSETDILIAAATNFTRAAEDLISDFEDTAPYTAALSPGSTGKLFAQIKAGAPYDIFLSADQERPLILTQDGIAVKGSQFTYAQGQLVLYGSDNPAHADTLSAGRFKTLAIANPDLAPYGRAAMEALENLDVMETPNYKIVMGENVGQAYALVHTGHADYGLVAQSHFTQSDDIPFSPVPQHLYAPIRQDAVLLKQSPAASAFMAYLRSQRARDIMRNHGYSHADG
ncbi:MAG: molybdate ABC transporter substrate-binding protein [Maricaulaceae bacterium]